MNAQLIVTSPNGHEAIITLAKPVITIGRRPQNDIVLADEKVSGAHARLEQTDEAYWLVDLGSSNGTWLNQKLLTAPALIHTGDTLRMGNTTLRLQVSQPVVAAPTSEPDKRLAQPATSEAKQEPEAVDDQSVQVNAPAPSKAKRTVDLANILDTLQQPSLPTGSGWRKLVIPQLVIHRQDAVTEFLLQQPLTVIGRDPDVDITIGQSAVSRRHAQIELVDQKYVLKDLGSKNGTLVGNQRLTSPHVLEHGDSIQIGSVQLIFKDIFRGDVAKPKIAKRAARMPVVIIPGTMGSDLWRGSQRVWPNVRTLLLEPQVFYLPDQVPLESRSIVEDVVVIPKLFTLEQYGRLGDYLQETLGYQRNVDLLEFAYDWRLDMRQSAQTLAERIAAWNVEGPIALIAHSQGCLVSRYYVECLGGKTKVGRQILIGGPNKGAPNSVGMLLPKDKIQLLPGAAFGGSIGEGIRGMYGSFPATYQFLPIYPAIVDQFGTPINLYEDESWLPEEKRFMLRAARLFREELGTQSSVPTICIFGYNHKTPVQLEITRDEAGNWLSLKMIEQKVQGDGSVPIESAILEGTEIHPVNQEHNSLYIDEDVFMRLKIELTR